MKKPLVAILAGRGPFCKYDEQKYKNTFWSSNKQDTIAFTNRYDFPDWNPQHFSVEHNGMPDKNGQNGSPEYNNTKSNMASLKNFVLNWADKNGYTKVWMFDENMSRVCKYGPYTKEDFAKNITVPYIKFPELPEIEHAYGGMAGSNFIKNRIHRAAKYCHMSPVSIHCWDIEKMKKITGGKILYHTTDEMMWEDYDYFLTLLQYGIRPMTFIEYAAQKATSQDTRVKQGSMFSAGMMKTAMLGFNLYKKWGSENVMAVRKVNMADITIRRAHSKVKPIEYRWRYDTLDNFLQDILDETDTNYARDSMLGKKKEYEWVNLIQNATKKTFTQKFGKI